MQDPRLTTGILILAHNCRAFSIFAQWLPYSVSTTTDRKGAASLKRGQRSGPITGAPPSDTWVPPISNVPSPPLSYRQTHVRVLRVERAGECEKVNPQNRNSSHVLLVCLMCRLNLVQINLCPLWCNGKPAGNEKANQGPNDHTNKSL